MKESIEEYVSKGNVERLGVVLTAREDDIKAEVFVKLVGQKYGYQATFKATRDVLEEGAAFDTFWDVAKQSMLEVLAGKKELTAIV